MKRWPALLLAVSLTAGADDALLDTLDDLRREHRISAVGLVIVERDIPGDGVRFSGGLGTVSHESDLGITGDTVFRIGSVTKGFTAWTLMRLQSAGKLHLDDRLDAHLDPTLWSNPLSETAPITLAQLLEHSAGFADISRAEWDVASPSPLAQNLRRFAHAHTVRWRPGDWSSYSNLGAALVGRAMERATDRPFETLLREQVLEPLRMNNSGFEPERVVVTGYDRDGITTIPYWHLVYRPFGALNVSLDDMARYLRWHLERGVVAGQALVSQDDLRRVETAGTTLAARLGLTWGYGLGNQPWLRDGFVFHGHGGDADGYLSRFGYSHALGKGYFLVINAFNSRALAAMRRHVEHHLIAGEPAPSALPRLTLDSGRFDWAAGAYRAVTARFGPVPGEPGYRVIVRPDRILLRRGDRTWTRYPVEVGNDRLGLARAGEPVVTAVLARLPDDRVVFIDDRLNLQREHAAPKPQSSGGGGSGSPW